MSAANPPSRDSRRRVHASTPRQVICVKAASGRRRRWADLRISGRSSMVGFAALTATLPCHLERARSGRRANDSNNAQGSQHPSSGLRPPSPRAAGRGNSKGSHCSPSPRQRGEGGRRPDEGRGGVGAHGARGTRGRQPTMRRRTAALKHFDLKHSLSLHGQAIELADGSPTPSRHVAPN